MTLAALALVAGFQAAPPTALLISAGSVELEPRGRLKDSEVRHQVEAAIRLPGTRNDVELAFDVLTCRYGFPRAGIGVLGVPEGAAPSGTKFLGARATRDAIIESIRNWLIKRQSGYGHAVLYISGHGAQKGGLEWFVAEDGQNVMDWEMHDLLHELKNKNVTLIFDVCHAGGGAKGEAMSRFGYTKQIQAEDLPPPKPDPTPVSGPKDRLESSKHILLAATGADQVALEIPVRRNDTGEMRRYGLFTLALYQTLINAPKGLQVGDAMAKINEDIRTISSGQIAEPQGALTPKLFGGEWRERLPLVDGAMPVGLLAGMAPGQRVAVDASTMTVRSVDWRTSTLGSVPQGAQGFVAKSWPSFAGVRYFPYDRTRSVRVAGQGAKPVAEPTLRYRFTVDESSSQAVVSMETPSGLESVYPVDARPNLTFLQDAVDVQAVVRTWQNPESPYGLRVITRYGSFPDIALDDRSGTTGEQLDMTLSVDPAKAAYLTLFSLEPDGSVAWHYPGPKDAIEKEPSHPLQLNLVKPAGESIMVALATPFPLRFPLRFPYEQDRDDENREGSRVIPARYARAFNNAIRVALAHGGEYGDYAIAPKPFIMEEDVPRDTVDVQTFVVRVSVP